MSVRVSRWIVPATGVTLALAGVAFLMIGELVPDPEAAVAAARSDAPAPPDRRPTARPAPAQRPIAPVVADARPAPAPAPAARRPKAQPLPALVAGRPPVRETRAVLRASPAVATLAQAPNLVERLQRLEELLQALSPEQAVTTLRGLLDSELPGDFYEAETLRLRVLARLGEVPGAAADELLIACLDAERPRPQRLLALEVLSGRDSAGRGELEGIARHDHDAVVQEKARWALTRKPRR